MNVLTYTSYKERYDLFSKIHGSIAVHSCQVGLAQKDIILLWKAIIITYRTGKPTGVENHKFITNFTLPEGTYSIDDFNAKIKIAVLQQGQGWKPPQIKTLRLVIPNEYSFIADNTIFIALGVQDYLEKTTLIRPPGSYKLSLDPLPKILSLHSKTKLMSSQMS